MDDKYVERWLRKIRACRKLTTRRNETRKRHRLDWELRKLDEMERRLKQDKYMYYSYQCMLRDWSHKEPNFDPYYRKNIPTEYLERSEPKGINTAVISFDSLREIKEVLTSEDAERDVDENFGVYPESIPSRPPTDTTDTA